MLSIASLLLRDTKKLLLIRSDCKLMLSHLSKATDPNIANNLFIAQCQCTLSSTVRFMITQNVLLTRGI